MEHGGSMKKIALLTSGGDSPGMNAAIRAVVRYSIFNDLEVYGIQRGFKGLINGDIEKMSVSSVADIVQRGGTILKTARSLEFMEVEGQRQAAKNLEAYGIEGLVVIGGDGSFRGARSLTNLGIPSSAIPATIDNDLSYTDYSIGFDTAVNTAIDAISKIRDTSASHERISIVEVMGRNCGDIALYAGMSGGAEAILVPEVPFTIEEIIDKLKQTAARGKKQSIIIVAEGAASAQEIAEKIYEASGMECRTTTLGHIQRGGAPTSYDRILGSKLGAKAIDCLLKGEESRAVGILNNRIMDMGIEEALEMPSRFDFKMHELSKKLSI